MSDQLFITYGLHYPQCNSSTDNTHNFLDFSEFVSFIQPNDPNPNILHLLQIATFEMVEPAESDIVSKIMTETIYQLHQLTNRPTAGALDSSHDTQTCVNYISHGA